MDTNDRRLSGAAAEIDDAAAQNCAEIASRGDNERPAVRFLTKAVVLDLLGISSTSLWELQIKAGFPAARVLHSDPRGTSGRSYWLAHEVEEWMLARPCRVLKCDRKGSAQQ